jgi:rhodanese-related sulfurtransferase
MRSKMLVILTIMSVLALTLSACGEEEVAVAQAGKEEVVVTATPEIVMAKTFNQMVAEAMAEVPGISPEEARRRKEADPRTLVIDPRDAADILATTGIIPGAMNISYGSLTWRADNEVPQEWREPELEDRSRPIIMACESGELGALAAKLLLDMGFTNVSNLEGGTLAWIDAGYPTEYIGPELTVQKQLPAGEADETWNHVKRDE